MSGELVPFQAEVRENREVAPGIFRMKLLPQEELSQVLPGRFFMLKAGRGHDPLLRRPLSHLGFGKKQGDKALEFMYEVRGRGTALLSGLRPSETVSVIGPLGSGFCLDPALESVVLAGGGMGAVPLFSAARELAAREQVPKMEFVYGARTGECLVLQSDLGEVGCQAVLCSEDGCAGEQGMVTDVLQKTLDRMDKGPELLLACGPRAMLKVVAGMAARRGIPCQVSLEARMGCGMGACLTCTIRGADGHNLRVCREGPVFDSGRIDWEALDDLP